jgi:hypothetical protein
MSKIVWRYTSKKGRAHWGALWLNGLIHLTPDNVVALMNKIYANLFILT